jgi:hypothetical protein
MPFWDRDIDVMVVTSDDAKSMNGLLAVVDRYHVGAILSVDIGDTRAGREWLDVIAVKNINVIEPGSGLGVADGIALTLDKGGWVKIETGATSISIGTPNGDSHVDVIVLAEVTDETVVWIKSIQPAIVVTRSPVKPERLVERIAFVNVEIRSAELIFDGVQWEVSAAP